MAQDLPLDSVYWAKELLTVEPEDAEADYVLAAEALEEHTPNVPEIKRHLDVLNKVKASPVSRLWIPRRLADLTGDDAAHSATFAEAGATHVGRRSGPVDRFAQLRLTALEIRSERRWPQLSGQVARLLEQVKGLGKPEEMLPTRVARLQILLEQTQKALTAQSAKLPPTVRRRSRNWLLRSRSIWTRSSSRPSPRAGSPTFRPTCPMPSTFEFRRQAIAAWRSSTGRLKTAQAQGPRRTGPQLVMGLHTVATEMILARVEDAERFTKAEPHIQRSWMVQEPTVPRVRSPVRRPIDLDRSGMAREAAESGAAAPTEPSALSKFRASALVHLKAAATALPDLAEAQARYGVALVLAQEPNLGRQYLQNAVRLGSLEPQYQLWAAWTILQAGYPEEAEPIVRSLLQQVDQGNLPREMEGTLHLLQGELYQARRSPEDLKKAVEEFDKAVAAGQATTPSAIIRLAQIDVQFGRYDQAMARLQPLRAQGKGGEAAEQLAILILQETGKKPEAKELLRRRVRSIREAPNLLVWRPP